MPNPKVGTVTPDVATAVKNAKAGQVQYRVDKAGIVHATIGRRSFESDKLRGNLIALLDALNKSKPSTVKGIYLRKLAVSSTMGVGVRVDTSSLTALIAERTVEGFCRLRFRGGARMVGRDAVCKEPVTRHRRPLVVRKGTLIANPTCRQARAGSKPAQMAVPTEGQCGSGGFVKPLSKFRKARSLQPDAPGFSATRGPGANC